MRFIEVRENRILFAPIITEAVEHSQRYCREEQRNAAMCGELAGVNARGLGQGYLIQVANYSDCWFYKIKFVYLGKLTIMRAFTDHEKEILVSINQHAHPSMNLGNVLDSYLRDCYIEIDYNADPYHVSVFLRNINNDIYGLQDKVGEIQYLIVQTVNLISLFEKQGYLFVIQTTQQINNPFRVGQYVQNNLDYVQYHLPDQNVASLLANYIRKEIYITPELGVFINNGFVTREEKRGNTQLKRQLIALVIAVLSPLFVVLINSLTKSNEVKINNTQFQELKKVGDSINSRLYN